MCGANIKITDMTKYMVALEGASASAASSKDTASNTLPAGKKRRLDIGSTAVDKVEANKKATIVELSQESLNPASKQKFREGGSYVSASAVTGSLIQQVEETVAIVFHEAVEIDMQNDLRIPLNSSTVKLLNVESRKNGLGGA